MLAKRMKPFSDAELIKKCMETVVSTLFCNFSNFKEIRDQISNLQLSDATCVHRIEHLGNQVFDSVINELTDCRFFSLSMIAYIYGYCINIPQVYLTTRDILQVKTVSAMYA